MKLTIRTTALALCGVFLMAHSTNAYSDVPQDKWYYSSVQQATANGWITGYTSDDTFRPNQSIQRAQMAKILGRLQSFESDSLTNPGFLDVSEQHSAYASIAYLTSKNVFQKNAHFFPGQPMTRAQFSKVLIKTVDLPYITDLGNPFSDVDESDWAFDYISYLYHAGIIGGVTPSKFHPNDSVTRAQATAMLVKALEFKKDPTIKNLIFDPYKEKYRTIHYLDEAMMQETIRLVNVERTKRGLTPLQNDPTLQRIATIKADDLATSGYWDHTSPTYGEPWDMANGFGYRYSAFGENIAHGYTGAAEVVKAWMNSEGHKENIIRSLYTHIGVGIVEDSKGDLYYVHMFSRK